MHSFFASHISPIFRGWIVVVDSSSSLDSSPFHSKQNDTHCHFFPSTGAINIEIDFPSDWAGWASVLSSETFSIRRLSFSSETLAVWTLAWRLSAWRLSFSAQRPSPSTQSSALSSWRLAFLGQRLSQFGDHLSRLGDSLFWLRDCLSQIGLSPPWSGDSPYLKDTLTQLRLPSRIVLNKAQ